MKLEKIISGGQTGVDRAALDSALDLGFPCGGWCPEGRLDEDGVIPKRYPVKPLKGGGYAERTRYNVLESTGTLIFRFGPLQGGTLLTEKCCREAGRPLLTVDGSLTEKEVLEKILPFLQKAEIKFLNVAGPRASEAAEAYLFTYRCMVRLLRYLKSTALPASQQN